MFDDAIAACATRQHGFITGKQVHQLGGSKHYVQTRLDAGRWRRHSRGVYWITGHALTWEARVAGAVLAGGDGSLASHRSAAVLWELDGIRQGPPEIVVPRHRRPRHLSGVRVHESTDLGLAEPRTRSGIQATGIERTLLDLGAVVDVRTVEGAIDSALRRRLTTWTALYGTLSRHSRKGRDGCAAFREVLDARFGDRVVPQSRFERLVANLLVDSGLPASALQHPVPDLFPWDIHLDLAYPSNRIGIELQSVAHHLNLTAFETDRERLTRLRLAGWTMLEFTWRFYVERSRELVAMVSGALADPGVT